MNAFVDAAASQVIRDVVLIGAGSGEESVPVFSQAQGGPVYIRFERSGFVFDQPIGSDTVVCHKATIEDWATSHFDADFRYIAFSIFEIVCFRRDSLSEDRPFIDKLVALRAGCRTACAGLILYLSTCGAFVFDSSSDAGLRLFCDGHLSVLEREYVLPLGLSRELLWERTERA